MARRGDYLQAGGQDQFIVPLLRRHIDRYLTAYLIRSQQKGHVLDIGCGSQPFRRRCEDAGWRYTGFDVVQNAQSTVDILGAIDALLPEDLMWRGPYHFILCTEVMEHVVDWPAAFTNMESLLAPGGHLLVTCPFFYPLHEEPYDFWRPTVHTLAVHAARAGLVSVDVRGVGDAWDVLGTLLASFTMSPADGTVSSRVGRLAARFSQRVAFAALRRQIPQRLVQAHSRIYLANVAVFRRPDGQ